MIAWVGALQLPHPLLNSFTDALHCRARATACSISANELPASVALAAAGPSGGLRWRRLSRAVPAVQPDARPRRPTAVRSRQSAVRLMAAATAEDYGRKGDPFSQMSGEERDAFFEQLDDACAAAGVGQSARFQGLLDAMRASESRWKVLSTGQVVEAAKHFPGLTAMPACDRRVGKTVEYIPRLCRP